jgi:oligopeptide transport system ATP-binding protein
MSEATLKPLLDVRNLKVHFPIYKGAIFRRQVNSVKAVDGIDLEILPGETLGLVGESGCGKSTTGRALLNLYEKGIANISGEVVYEGVDLTQLSHKELRKYRQKLQIIFQDPYASLNPRMTVGAIISEPIRIFKLASGPDVMKRVRELMELVGLSPSMVRRYPHEFSGGQRQRIGIARALALEPDFIVCDEPISALDVSIQAQVMNLMQDLQKKLNLTYLFIAHDLAAVRHISDRVAVMYLGRVVELAAADDIYKNPQHPYTKALISAVPVPDPTRSGSRGRTVLGGEVPSPLNPPTGCTFHTRCPLAEARCKEESPTLRTMGDGHKAACHLI